MFLPVILEIQARHCDVFVQPNGLNDEHTNKPQSVAKLKLQLMAVPQTNC